MLDKVLAFEFFNAQEARANPWLALALGAPILSGVIPLAAAPAGDYCCDMPTRRTAKAELRPPRRTGPPPSVDRLEKICLEKGLRMKRQDVFIANVIKCRPPQNRNPEPPEILACQPFLEAQIRAIRPRVLVGLGKFGAQWLLKTAEPITRLRGRMGEFLGIPVMPTFHPAYLLRNPSAKKEVWADIKVVMSLVER